ncbi:MAG: hypothetical protein WDM92_01310 [Caulobacteraceae bacterium]
MRGRPGGCTGRAARPVQPPWILMRTWRRDVALYPGVVVGPGARIGRGSEIGANSVVGPGVCIGRGCRIGANVSIGFALIGDDVRILSGAVIGEAGFGVAAGRGGTLDVPQLGRVIVQDHVTIGACTCVDRGAWDDTVIGEGPGSTTSCRSPTTCAWAATACSPPTSGCRAASTVGDGAMFGGPRGRRRPCLHRRRGGDHRGVRNHA